MLGAIIGDIVGKPYEFTRNNIKTTNFPLFSEKSRFSDDTVMTVAMADAIRSYGLVADEIEAKNAIIDSMHKWGRKYPFAGYGQKFALWIYGKKREPYGSWGNGAAMRVSPFAWCLDTLPWVEHFAEISASVTHNHPEGINGAKAIAGAIFKARIFGVTKEEIKRYVDINYGYDLDRTLDEIRPSYTHIETAEGTVPVAIIAFLESESFEDCIRKAVSIGGDSDTIAAMSGSIAEAFYNDIPEWIIFEALKRLDEDIIQVIFDWYSGYDCSAKIAEKVLSSYNKLKT